ncbi:hypothetical protein PLCT1_01432 [Planctomycetaceae bacterium]|nr:hypothetical protein PLCT1_01432 [Planctomycetaceae bacterium]
MNTTTNAAATRARALTGVRRFFYVLVVLAAWNAVLRPSVSIPVTPYYLLAPVVAAWLLANDPPFRRWIAWFGAASLYALTIGLVYGVPLMMQLAQLLKYFQLLVFFGMLAWLLRTDPQAPRKLVRIVMWLGVAVFVIAALQAATGFEFPTVVNEESALWLNTFFFTPNDLALFLCGIVAMALVSRMPLVSKAAIIGLVCALNLRNDAKAGLLAIALMVTMTLLLAVCRRTRTRPIAALALLAVAVPLVVVALAETTFGTEDTDFDFLQLFLDPLQHLMALEPYDLGGSIFDRTDALIHSLTALRSMAWLGLGPGGSVYTLSLPNFELLTAKSLHNALAELLVELGPVMVILAWIVLRPVLRALWRRDSTTRDRGRMLLLVAAPMLSVSQSSGYISNYAFWLAAYVLWFWRVAETAPRRRPAKRPVRRLPPSVSQAVPA